MDRVSKSARLSATKTFCPIDQGSYSTEGATNELSKHVCLSVRNKDTLSNQSRKLPPSKVEKSSYQRRGSITSELRSSESDCRSPGEILDPYISPTTSEDTEEPIAGVLTERERGALLYHFYSLYPSLAPEEGCSPAPEGGKSGLCSTCQANFRPRNQGVTRRRVEVNQSPSPDSQPLQGKEDQQPSPDSKPVQGVEDPCAPSNSCGAKNHQA